eukprot:TRINITY_DN6018_c0_g1_i2.p1 TRINITY_DN6018_c0_g1~~TRINITY_DN6018_c0_g1_i2.p1  ORF type:complete len:241 (+),score=60.55 TRINITY_DN6018_c0_g1_i2:103-723(+)
MKGRQERFVRVARALGHAHSSAHDMCLDNCPAELLRLFAAGADAAASGGATAEEEAELEQRLACARADAEAADELRRAWFGAEVEAEAGGEAKYSAAKAAAAEELKAIIEQIEAEVPLLHATSEQDALMTKLQETYSAAEKDVAEQLQIRANTSSAEVIHCDNSINCQCTRFECLRERSAVPAGSGKTLLTANQIDDHVPGPTEGT